MGKKKIRVVRSLRSAGSTVVNWHISISNTDTTKVCIC